MSSPGDGYYPDPQDPTRLRRWTGSRWVNEFKPLPGPPTGEPVEAAYFHSPPPTRVPPPAPAQAASQPPPAQTPRISSATNNSNRNGFITAGLVFSILGLVPIVAIAFSTAAIVIGAVGLRRASKGVEVNEKTRSLWVLALGIAGTLVTAFVYLLGATVD